MFRLTTAPVRHARHLLANALPRATPTSAPLPAAVGRRTYKKRPKSKPKIRLRPDPDARAERNMNRRPVEVVLTKRTLSEFKLQHKKTGSRTVTAEETYDIYSKYMDAMAGQEKPSDTWVWNFVRQNDILPVTLHDIGVFLLSFPKLVPEEYHLVCHLLNSAAALGHDGSALTLGRLLLRADAASGSPFQYHGSAWEAMRQRVDRLIREGRDANALVIEGLMHLRKKTKTDDYLAVEAFSKAYELGKQATDFDWRETCMEGMGDAWLRLGEKDKAEQTFLELAHADYGRGYYLYARQRPDSPHYLNFLKKAAVSGEPDSWELLMNEHMRLSELCENQGLTTMAERHRTDAAEWGLLLRTRRKRLGKNS